MKSVMYSLMCLLVIIGTVTAEVYRDDSKELLNDILNDDPQDTTDNSDSKRGWEAWFVPKGTKGKRAWEASGIGYTPQIYRTLYQLKRGWEGINWRYGRIQGKRSSQVVKEKESNSLSQSCKCCEKLKYSMCCLSCSLEQELFTRDFGKEKATDKSLSSILCDCCVNNEDTNCCRGCNLL